MIAGAVITNTSGITDLITLTKTRDVTLKGAKAAGRIVSKAAKSKAPKVSGALKAAIGVKAAKGTQGQTASYAVIGARKKVVKMVTRPGRRKPMKAVAAFYLHLVEKGTQPHQVGKGSKIGRKGKETVGKGGKHPGTKPRPFLGPAFEATKSEASDAALKAMAEEIQKQIAKASAKIHGQLGGK